MTQQAVRIILLLLSAIGTVWAQAPPVVGNLEASALAYQEGNQAQPLSNTIRLSSDNPVTQVVVQVSGYVASEDELTFSDTENIHRVIDKTNGTLLLLSYPAGSSQPAASFQNALRSVTYRNTNEATPDTGERTLSFQAFDNQGQRSASASRILVVTAENDAPVVFLANDAPISYPAGTGVETPLFETIEVADGDSELLNSAEVTISTGFQNAEDRLLMANAPTGIGVAGGGSRTLTLTGPAPPAAFRRALRSVQFSNQTPLNVLPTEGIRRITVKVSDGSAESLSVSRFVVVGTPSNLPPRIQAISKEVTAGNALSFTNAEFAAQYSDPDNDPFTGIFIRSKPERGTLLLGGEEVTNSRILSAGPNGLRVASGEFATLTYQAPTDYFGEDQFLWNAIDGTTFAVNSVPVRIVVNPPELQLTLGAVEPVTTPAGQSAVLPPVAFSANRQVPVTATLSVGNGVLSLPPEIVPLFTFTSGDGNEDASLVFTGGADAVAYGLSGIRYTPRENYSGTETLSVNVSSSNNVRAQSSVAIVVVSNKPPTVSDLPLTTLENQPYVFTRTDFVERYEDPDNSPSEGPAQIRLTNLPQNGNLIYRGDTLRPDNVPLPGGYVVPVADLDARQLVYVPNPGFSGSDEARWNAFDGAAVALSAAAIQITVLPALTIAADKDSLTVCPGSTDTLRVNVTSAPNEEITYNWSCVGNCGFTQPANQAEVVVSPTQTTTYVVTVTSPATAVSVQDTIAVVVADCPSSTLNIPNTFTPNGDKSNNEWAIGSSSTLPPVAVEVFDRYGHSVYRNQEYQDNWDGTYQGQALPEGTYYYLISDAGGQVYKGALTILR